MLLFVIETDFHQWRDRRQRVLVGLVKKFHGRGVDMPAVGGDFVGAGAGQMATLVTGMARAGPSNASVPMNRLIVKPIPVRILVP